MTIQSTELAKDSNLSFEIEMLNPS